MVEATLDLTPHPLSAPPPGVLQQIRAATATRHKRLEARLPLTSAALDLDTYKRIIEAYYGFHVPLQRAIEKGLGTPIAPERQKVSALIKDLRALGLTPAQIDVLPLCDALPTLDGYAQVLGVMYVMEGATLGGQVLRRIIADRLGVDAQSGGEFLDVYGRDTGRLWKAFLGQLAEFDHPDGNQQVVDAACATFDSFEHWLNRAGVLI